jgi:hypothetical protein
METTFWMNVMRLLNGCQKLRQGLEYLTHVWQVLSENIVKFLRARALLGCTRDLRGALILCRDAGIASQPDVTTSPSFSPTVFDCFQFPKLSIWKAFLISFLDMNEHIYNDMTSNAKDSGMPQRSTGYNIGGLLCIIFWWRKSRR